MKTRPVSICDAVTLNDAMTVVSAKASEVYPANDPGLADTLPPTKLRHTGMRVRSNVKAGPIEIRELIYRPAVSDSK